MGRAEGKPPADSPARVARDLAAWVEWARGRGLVVPLEGQGSPPPARQAEAPPARTSPRPPALRAPGRAAPRARAPVAPMPAPPPMAVPENDSLETVAAEVAACTRCRLSNSRRKAVPGEGPAPARLMVIGEGPGNREDVTGRPFVGDAGKMLTRMIEEERALGTPRSAVFIANVVKCHPPGNRDPEPDEIAACRPYLDRQVALVRPRAVLVLGRVAAQSLLETREPISRLRGKVVTLFGVPAVPTFHPAYLLRTPADKRLAFEDLLTLKGILARGETGGT